MDLKKMKNIGIVIVFSAIGLLINTNIVTAQNGNKADAVYEMQKIILSDEADDLNGTDEQKYSDGSDYNGNYLEGKRELTAEYILLTMVIIMMDNGKMI